MTSLSIYNYIPHQGTSEKLCHRHRPVRVSDQLPKATAVERFNSWLAVRVTDGVGSMWCAYAFAALALVSLPSAIGSGSLVTLVSWVSQTFLQLVVLSVIIVGQNVLAAAADRRGYDPLLRQVRWKCGSSPNRGETLRRGRGRTRNRPRSASGLPVCEPLEAGPGPQGSPARRPGRALRRQRARPVLRARSSNQSRAKMGTP
jgi:hypothetical protein